MGNFLRRSFPGDGGSLGLSCCVKWVWFVYLSKNARMVAALQAIMATIMFNGVNRTGILEKFQMCGARLKNFFPLAKW